MDDHHEDQDDRESEHDREQARLAEQDRLAEEQKQKQEAERREFMIKLAEALEDLGAEFVDDQGAPWVDVPLEFRTWLMVDYTPRRAAEWAFNLETAPESVTGTIFTADETGAADNGHVVFVARLEGAAEFVRAAVAVYEKQVEAMEAALGVPGAEG